MLALLLVLGVVAAGAVMGAFGVFVAFAGTMTLRTGLREWWLSKLASRWVPVAGKVVRSEVERQQTRRVTNHVPVVTYEFVNDGRTHRSTRLAFTTSLSPPYRNEAQAREITARLAVGSDVTAYWDPARPQEATLERNHPYLVEPVFFFLLLVGTGVAFVFLGADMAINAIRNPPRF